MDVLINFGSRIRELRMKLGMTQEALASLAEMDRSYVGAIERGEKNLSLINIAKLADALDVDLGYIFEDDHLSPRSVVLRREQKRPLKERFLYDVDVMENVIAWKIAGPLNEYDVKEIVQQIRSMTLLLRKGEIKLLVDNRSMVIDGMAFVFSPEVNLIWEDLQRWLVPFVNKVAVLCNSKLMKNQLERLAKRSGINKYTKQFFNEDPAESQREALEFLGLNSNRLLEKIE